MWSRWKTAAVMAAFVGAPLTASAQLDSLGPVNQNGTGFGNVNTVLTLSSPANSSTEAGCIGPAIATCVPGDLVPGTSHSHLYTVGDFSGLSGSNLRLFLNFNEPGNASGGTLDGATLTLYNGNTILFHSSTAGAINFSSTDPGTGNSGFAFGLSSSDAALFDTFLSQSGSANYTLGLSSSLSNVTGGPETWYLGTTTRTSTVPEPGSMALLGTGLVGLIPMARRKLRK